MSSDEGQAATLDPDAAEREAMRLALLELPLRQRTAIALRFYEDLSEAQIAEVLRCRPGTGKSLISRGLAPGLHVSGTPAWSPDGSSIAIAANGADHRPHVFVLSLSSGEVRQLTEHLSRAPAWSPDGERIAFLARDLSPWRVYINESDGGSAGEVVTPPIWVGSTLLWDDAPIP